MCLKLSERTISGGQTYTINHIPPLISLSPCIYPCNLDIITNIFLLLNYCDKGVKIMIGLSDLNCLTRHVRLVRVVRPTESCETGPGS